MRYAESHHLTREQARSLYEITKDGDATQEELKHLNGWSAQMVEELRREIELPEINVNVSVHGNITASATASYYNDATSGNYSTWSHSLNCPSGYTESGGKCVPSSLSSRGKGHTIWMKGYATGGYTGDIPTNQIAGVVHGQEYVVPRKGALVIRENNNSVFQSILSELRELRKENKDMKEELKKIEKTNKITAVESRKSRKLMEENQ